MRIGLDLDGTIITCESKHCILMEVVTRAIGLEFCISRYWEDKRSGLNNKQSLLSQGIALGDAEIVDNTWIASIENIEWTFFDTLLTGALDDLVRLRAQGNSLHLISSRNNAANALIQLRTLGIDRFFDTVNFVSLGSGLTKSDFLNELNIDCYIGDTEADYEASRKSNISFYPVTTGMRDKDFFVNLGLEAKILSKLGQFPKWKQND